MLLGGKFVVDHTALSLAHTLNDDLTGSLGGDAAKVAGLDLNADNVAQLGTGQLFAGLFQTQLGGGIVNRFHHVLLDEHTDLAGLFVALDNHVVAHALMVTLIGRNQSLGDLFDHIGLGDAFLLFDQADSGKKFLAVQFIALGSDFLFSHLDYSLKCHITRY